MRRFDTGRLIIATHNTGKLVEFQTLLAPYVKDVVSAGSLGLPEPEETGTTFVENALLKAHAAAQATGAVALADDSGLCVHALGDRPGLYSARWAILPNDPTKKDMNYAMQRIQDELGNASDRSAHFVCVLALAWPDGHAEIVEGRCDGAIVWPPRGAHGHGYDPLFMPDGDHRTFAEMSEDEKNKISHRGMAMEKLIGLIQKMST